MVQYNQNLKDRVTPEEASLERIPNNQKDIDDETFEQVMKLIDAIEADDVVQVYHNMDVDQSFPTHRGLGQKFVPFDEEGFRYNL